MLGDTRGMLQIVSQHLAATLSPSPLTHTNPPLPAVHQAVHVVDLLVGPVPPVVLPQVLDGGNGQDEDDGREGELRLERVHHRHEVEQRDEDKVNIGEAVELLEEILRQEGEHGVLGGLDLVAGVVSVWVLLALGAVEEYVDVHEARLALLALLFSRPLDFGGSLGRPRVLGVPRHNRPGPGRAESSRAEPGLQTFPHLSVSRPLIRQSVPLCYHSFSVENFPPSSPT